ncbi:MAG: replication-associated recombination protein A [Saprospiraceae bacterium]|nr:replication-associated recombination protein A [Saprospiraceae bacterium]
MNIPLAERVRPRNLDEYIGQEHLTGEGSVLRKMIESESIPSFILWGPPGVGKTTLASLIAHSTQRPFYTLSAINSGVKDIREVIDKAKSQQFFGKNKPILFIDEIHRFSKSQQDSLLGAVEKGTITLIGATTENPSFEVISALLSRCQVYILKALNRDDLNKIIQNAITKDEILKIRKFEFRSLDALLAYSGGDARKLLNCLELITNQCADNTTVIVDNQVVKDVLQQNILLYDKSGEMHYDIISAFIKSIRASDPNAALYYMARMIEGGEDPLFICRRMIILAAEDIGLANPNALLLAKTCFDSVHQIGMPEARIIMSEAAIYLACSPKSNSAYLAIDQAIETVRKTGNLPIPLHLRNAPTQLMKEIGYSAGYKYAHDYENNFVNMECLPEAISNQTIYQPGNNQAEQKLRDFLKNNWKDKYGY